jgi:hypothetical protein
MAMAGREQPYLLTIIKQMQLLSRKLTRGRGLILSIDSNSRGKLWHDTHTNQRGKNLEEFIITSDLFLMNEETDTPTFETVRGRSWIDLTLYNNIVVKKIRR